MDIDLLSLTADIVSAHVSNNEVTASELPTLIGSVFNALNATGAPATLEAPKKEPAVSIRASVNPDYIVCLEDGAKMKMLKRYLMTNFQMTPDAYRTKWGLPRDYPMVSPNYAEQRRTLAKQIGLGRKKVVETVVEPAKRAAKSVLAGLDAAREHLRSPTDKKPRGRPKKVAAEESPPANEAPQPDFPVSAAL